MTAAYATHPLHKDLEVWGLWRRFTLRGGAPNANYYSHSAFAAPPAGVDRDRDVDEKVEKQCRQIEAAWRELAGGSQYQQFLALVLKVRYVDAAFDSLLVYQQVDDLARSRLVRQHYPRFSKPTYYAKLDEAVHKIATLAKQDYTEAGWKQ